MTVPLSLSAVLLAVSLLQPIVVVARLGNESSSPSSGSSRLSKPLVDPMEQLADKVDGEGCYVVTIFGLKTADCDKRNARSVPQSLDSDLQVLRFEDNRLTVLGDGQFSSYANLQEIYLARNRLELIEATALRGLYSLQILDLEANRLSAVPAKSLRAVASSLRLLSLKNNPIRRLDADSLSSLTRLEDINFEDCWLEYISPAAFSGLERLSSLNLVNNELRTLDSSMHATLPMTVRVLRLYRNPWTCDCRLRWLRLWTGAEDARVNWDFASNTPTCAAPALIRGVAWRHLSADQFACPSRIVRLSSGNQTAATSGGIHAPPGLNASITCTAAGDPQPIISWSRGDGGDGQVLGPPRAVISVTQGTVGDDGEPRIVGVLTLLGVSASRDSGDYSCMAENTAGRAEMTFKLIVSDSPLTGATSTSSVDRDVFLGTRDVFLGTLLGLLTVACVVILCTVLRLRSIARQRQRRSADSKNVHYSSAATTTDTATNHVSPLPTSNHRSVADVESAQTASALTTVDHDDDDDDDSRSSEERSSVVDGEQTVTTTAVSSPRRPLLLPNHHNQRLWTAAEQQQRRRCSEDNCDAGRRSSRNREKYCDAAARRQQLQRDEASRSLLSTEPDTRFLEEEEEEEEEEDTHENYDNDDDGTASVSDRQSEVATSDAETTRTNGDDDTTNAQRERGASRAVSFGPDMIIDARRRRSSCSSSVQGDSEAAAARDDHDMFNDGAGGDCTKHSDADVDDRSRTQRHRRDESPASILHQRPPAPAAVDYSPLCSPPTAASRSSTPDRRANPPGLSDMVDSLAPRSTYSTRPTERGASHGGELRLVGNGSVRTGTGAGVGSRLADHHPLSPQTTAPQSSSVPPPFSRGLQSASLDRCLPARTRRRLPVPSNTGLRRSTAPRLFSGQTAW